MKDKNEHKYQVSQEFQDYWETVCNEPHKALMEKLQAWMAWQHVKGQQKIVKTKSIDELKQMVRRGEIELLHVSDDGEMYAYGTKGNPQHVMHIWLDNHDSEYMVVDHPNLISSKSYERLKVLFKPKD